MNEKLLILEDENEVLFALEKNLKKDFDIEIATDLEMFHEKINYFNPEVLLMDVRLPDGNAIDYIKKEKLNKKNSLIFLMSGYAEEEYVIEGSKLEISGFFKKPVPYNEIKYIIRKNIKEKNIKDANKILTSKFGTEIICKSPKMEKTLEDAVTFAQTNQPVLITGETGSGKQVMANFIHIHSKRNNNTFLDINCAAISETLLESQLFGHKKGAFTDAKSDFKGFFELTDGGTLFLDEISEMRPELQAKLLKVVENHEILPIGANKPKKVDVRLITATNRPIVQYIEKGKFRQDLFYRLNVLNINIPPLRKRKEDIPLLIKNFVKEASKKLNRRVEVIPDKTMKKYIDYEWPGNVRELKNVIYRAVLLSSGEELEGDFFVAGKTANNFQSYEIPEEGIELEKIVMELEKNYIKKALYKTGGSQSQAAKLLGITRDMLRYRIKNYKITCK
ncbi:MAG: sigma-54-dependent transcriptional regulator [Candidatus Muiribacteriota bacterium]